MPFQQILKNKTKTNNPPPRPPKENKTKTKLTGNVFSDVEVGVLL